MGEAEEWDIFRPLEGNPGDAEDFLDFQLRGPEAAQVWVQCPLRHVPQSQMLPLPSRKSLPRVSLHQAMSCHLVEVPPSCPQEGLVLSCAQALEGFCCSVAICLEKNKIFFVWGGPILYG